MALLLTLFLFNTDQVLDSSSICIRSSIQLSGVTYVHTYIRTCINIFKSKDVQWKVHHKLIKGTYADQYGKALGNFTGMQLSSVTKSNILSTLEKKIFFLQNPNRQDYKTGIIL